MLRGAFFYKVVDVVSGNTSEQIALAIYDRDRVHIVVFDRFYDRLDRLVIDGYVGLILILFALCDDLS